MPEDMAISLSPRGLHLEEGGSNLRFMHAILQVFKLDQNSRVLEIGCGTGILGKYIASCVGAEVVGTELSASTAQIAGYRLNCYHTLDGELSKELGQFDLVYCKDVLPMIDDKSKFATDICGLLRTKGGFMTYMPNKDDFAEKPLYRHIPGSKSKSIDCYGAVQEFVSNLQQAGFNSVETFRLMLGPMHMDGRYVEKHADGFFNNTNIVQMEKRRRQGLAVLNRLVEDMAATGLRLDYDWERTAVVARI
ncbi:MAG TPA: class I SAM-dependent methyltransferase [Phycisphaerales bacterium]|nr:class I SAM-dependent methyltransferase [Phycisphaerales bacterium]